jgi:hypothetical protein
MGRAPRSGAQAAIPSQIAAVEDVSDWPITWMSAGIGSRFEKCVTRSMVQLFCRAVDRARRDFGSKSGQHPIVSFSEMGKASLSKWTRRR